MIADTRISVEGTRITATVAFHVDPIDDLAAWGRSAAELLPEDARGLYLLAWERKTRATRYWRRRAHRLRSRQRRELEPMLGRSWRRFRRNFCGGPAFWHPRQVEKRMRQCSCGPSTSIAAGMLVVSCSRCGGARAATIGGVGALTHHTPA